MYSYAIDQASEDSLDIFSPIRDIGTKSPLYTPPAQTRDGIS